LRNHSGVQHTKSDRARALPGDHTDTAKPKPHDHAGENPHLARTPEKQTKRQVKGGGSVHGGARVC